MGMAAARNWACNWRVVGGVELMCCCRFCGERRSMLGAVSAYVAHAEVVVA